MVGVEMTSFLAILGAAGLAVGLALKDTLQNLTSSVENEWLILSPNKLVSYDPKKVTGLINVQPISETIVTGIPVQLVNKPNDINVFVNPATVSLTIVGGLEQITSISPEDIDVITVSYTHLRAHET